MIRRTKSWPPAIPTHTIHPINNRVTKGLALLALIAVLLLDLFVWRP